MTHVIGNVLHRYYLQYTIIMKLEFSSLKYSNHKKHKRGL